MKMAIYFIPIEKIHRIAEIRKKYLILVVFFALLPLSIFALNFAAGGFCAINAGWFSGRDWNDLIDYYEENYQNASNEVEIAFTAAAFIEIALSDNFAFQPEIQFSMTKGGYKITDNGDVFRYTETINSLFIPLLCKYRIGAAKGMFVFFAGPAVIVIIGSIVGEDDYDANGSSDKYSYKYEPYTRTGFGFTSGIGYELPLGPGFLLTELRYSKSFMRYFNNEDTVLNSFGPVIGYKINF